MDEVLPRATELQDPAVANVDQVLLVFAMERPALDLKGATRQVSPPLASMNDPWNAQLPACLSAQWHLQTFILRDQHGCSGTNAVSLNGLLQVSCQYRGR